MLDGVAALAGVALQLAAVVALLHGDGGTAALLGYLGLQALASAMLVLPLWRRLPVRMRTPFGWTCACLFVFGLFVPLGGLLLCVLGWLLARIPAPVRDSSAVGTVVLPEFASQLAARAAPPGRPGGARLRAQAANAAAPDAQRLTALAAMQAMPARSTSPLLRALLADSVDDVRLLAYGMLDAAEKHLTQQILQGQARLREAADAGPAASAAAHEQLAQLHWELVYQNLVQGDVRDYTVEQADRHAEQALHALSQVPGANTLYVGAADGSAVASPAAGLWQLRGRLALARNDAAAARAALQRATALGFPRERALPLVAEAAYLEGDFAAVRSAMQSLRLASALPPLPQLQPLLRYWTS